MRRPRELLISRWSGRTKNPPPISKDDKMNSQEATPNERVFVLPGDILGDDSFKSGSGTYIKDGVIHAAQVGVLNINRDFINIMPAFSSYVPKHGDSVIGIIVDNGPSSWMVNIGCPYTAMMHTNDVQWNVKYGDTGKYLKPGDAILAKVSNVNEVKKIQIAMKEHGLRKLESGILVKVPQPKVPRIIGKGGSMIAMLKQKTQTRMFVGQNGMIWVEGEDNNMEVVSQAIQIIKDRAHVSGLTDYMENYLDSQDCRDSRDSPDIGSNGD